MLLRRLDLPVLSGHVLRVSDDDGGHGLLRLSVVQYAASRILTGSPCRRGIAELESTGEVNRDLVRSRRMRPSRILRR